MGGGGAKRQTQEWSFTICMKEQETERGKRIKEQLNLEPDPTEEADTIQERQRR